MADPDPLEEYMSKSLENAHCLFDGAFDAWCESTGVKMELEDANSVVGHDSIVERQPSKEGLVEQRLIQANSSPNDTSSPYRSPEYSGSAVLSAVVHGVSVDLEHQTLHSLLHSVFGSRRFGLKHVIAKVFRLQPSASHPFVFHSMQTLLQYFRYTKSLGQGKYGSVYLSTFTVSAKVGTPDRSWIDTINVPLAVKLNMEHPEHFDPEKLHESDVPMSSTSVELVMRELRTIRAFEAVVAMGACPHFPLLYHIFQAKTTNHQTFTSSRSHDISVFGYSMETAMISFSSFCQTHSEIDIAPLLAQCVVGIAVAARVGIVHNDLYPSNVLVYPCEPTQLRYVESGTIGVTINTCSNSSNKGLFAVLSDWGLVTSAALGPRSTVAHMGIIDPYDNSDFKSKPCMDGEHEALYGKYRRSGRLAEAETLKLECVVHRTMDPKTGVHVTYVKEVPLWCRDLIAIVVGVYRLTSCRLSEAAFPWITAVYYAVKEAVLKQQIMSPNAIVDFAKHITSESFCLANNAEYVYRASFKPVMDSKQCDLARGSDPTFATFDLDLVQLHQSVINRVLHAKPF